MKSHLFKLTTLFLALAGCASPEEKADELRQERVDARNEELQDQVDALPSWVIAAPKPDATGYYAVGIGKSTDLNLALKKARLEAEFALAKLYSQTLSGGERMYQKDGALTQQQFTALIDKIVTEVPVVGYTVENQKVLVSDAQYQAYLLLKLPYDEFNTVLKQQQGKVTDAEMRDAFAELERRLLARRQLARDDTSSDAHPPSPQGDANN